MIFQLKNVQIYQEFNKDFEDIKNSSKMEMVKIQMNYFVLLQLSL